MTTFVEKSGRIYFDKIAYQRRFFNRFSTSYWFLNILSFGLANRTRRRSLAALRIREGGTVCDLMCGDGGNIGILRKYYRCGKIIGIDISDRMIQCARNRFGELDTIYLIENVLSSSIPSDSCDAVSCTFGLKILPREQMGILISEVDRILKPSGTFVFAELSKPKNEIYYFLWSLYFLYFLPIVGRLFSCPFVEKKYLSNSIDHFGSIASDEQRFRFTFSKVNSFSWYGGIVTGISGHKKEI
ncbi:methyltransferase, UbiE/COQ5 family [Leptospira weilii str. 2006001855]|uniref:Methyltransferase, UbiE/COQ5 family n=1 Tax=Leptospira weilii str. 2006001855 TaxID=996804 RepID=M6FNM5_9LEPT|nr:class I SAM-dependent methyltransferase [Leptospira weilii]EMM71739.1 methyltransferase, UbiE/COQ5 family [Leptospira weilii str. 2006001855]